MLKFAVDPVLSYQLSQAISSLIKRPGQVSVDNIKRIAELYGFDTFTEKIDLKTERLTIAGMILLIDIDFVNGKVSREDKKTSKNVDLDNDEVMKTEEDEINQLTSDSERTKQIVENVSLSLASDQRVQVLLDSANSNETGDGNNDSRKNRRLVLQKLLYQLKNFYSFTSNDFDKLRSSNRALLNCLKPPQTQSAPNADGLQQIEYDITKLNAFSENLKYLAELDRLSIYIANNDDDDSKEPFKDLGVSAGILSSLNGDDTSSTASNAHGKLNSSHSTSGQAEHDTDGLAQEVSGTVDLFNYLNELSLVFNFFSAHQSKILISRLLKEREIGNKETAFFKILDILNGYLKYGKAVPNIGNNKIGLFVNYWENNRLLRYKRLLAQYKQQVKTTQSQEDDVEMKEEEISRNESKEALSESELNEIIKFYELTFPDQRQRFKKNMKYIKLGVDYHFRNGLVKPHDILNSEYFKASNNDALKLPELLSGFKDGLATTLTNINFMSHLKLGHSILSTFHNPQAKVSLNMKFSCPVWIPSDLLGRNFQTFVTYDELPHPANTNDDYLSSSEDDTEDNEFSDMLSSFGPVGTNLDSRVAGSNGISDLLKFRNKKRNNINEIYIKHYNDLFTDKSRKSEIIGSRRHNKRLIKPNLNYVLGNITQNEKSNYLIKFNTAIVAQKDSLEDEQPAKTLKAKMQFSYRLISSLKKIKSINLYNDSVEKSSDSSIDTTARSDALKEQLLKLRDNINNNNTKSNGFLNVINDPRAPLLTPTSASFFKTNPGTGKTTMATVTSTNVTGQFSPALQNQSISDNIDVVKSLELFFESLRSLSLLWTLIDSLSSKSIILSREHESYIKDYIKDVIQDTTPEIIGFSASGHEKIGSNNAASSSSIAAKSSRKSSAGLTDKFRRESARCLSMSSRRDSLNRNTDNDTLILRINSNTRKPASKANADNGNIDLEDFILSLNEESDGHSDTRKHSSGNPGFADAQVRRRSNSNSNGSSSSITANNNLSSIKRRLSVSIQQQSQHHQHHQHQQQHDVLNEGDRTINNISGDKGFDALHDMLPFLNITVSSLPNSSKMAQLIFNKYDNVRVDEADNGNKKTSSIYELQLSTNLPIFKWLKIASNIDIGSNSSSVAQIGATETKILRFFIYNGAVVNVELLVQDKLCISALDDTINLYGEYVAKLRKLQEVVNITEDLYYLFCSLLKSECQ